MSDDSVGMPPTFKDTLKEILQYAAARDRTVIEFRTRETEDGNRHFSVALDITDHVDKLEERDE